MNSALTYRNAGPDDLEQLKELGLVTFGQYKPFLEEQHWKTMEGNLSSDEKLLELIGISKVFVCCEGERIVGRAFLVPQGHTTPIFEPGWAQIRMVGVHPDYSGKGIAKKLTQLCIDEAKRLNETTIALHTSEMMDAARHIYENLGFKQVKEIDRLFGKRYWLYHLVL